MKKGLLFSFSLLFAAVTVFSAVFLPSHITKPPLSAEEIAALREEYPAVDAAPPNLYMMPAAFEDYVLEDFSLAYIEILGEKEYHRVTLSDPIPEIAEKREEMGLSDRYGFFHYRVRVIQDARGRIPKGTELYISVPIMYEATAPNIRTGDRLVLPLSEDPFWDGNYQFTTLALYYVTDSGHLMSAFFEDYEETPRTGQHFSTLLREFE